MLCLPILNSKGLGTSLVGVNFFFFFFFFLCVCVFFVFFFFVLYIYIYIYIYVYLYRETFTAGIVLHFTWKRVTTNCEQFITLL